MGNVNEALITKIGGLNIPENLKLDLLVDVDMDSLANANVVQTGNVFQVSTKENGVLHAFSFADNNIIVETVDVLDSEGLKDTDVADMARIKRQRNLSGVENGFNVLTIESDRRFYSEDKGYREHVSTVVASYDVKGNIYDEKHSIYMPISKDGDLDKFANAPLPGLETLVMANSYNGVINTAENARAL